MSARSCSRSSPAARARCSSRSGRRPAFQASTKSLRMRSESGATKDLLHFVQAAAAALVDVVGRDAEALGDRLAVELLAVRELEDGAVVVVAHPADRPVHEALGGLAALLLVQRVVGAGPQLLVVGGERAVVRAAVAAVVPCRVEAPRGALEVAQLLAAEVHARVLDHAHDRGPELAELARAEARAHGDHAEVRLRGRARRLVGRQAGAAGEAEAAAEDRDAVEAALAQSLPGLRRLRRAPALAGDHVAAQQEVVGFVRHAWKGRAAGGGLTARANSKSWVRPRGTPNGRRRMTRSMRGSPRRRSSIRWSICSPTWRGEAPRSSSRSAPAGWRSP